MLLCLLTTSLINNLCQTWHHLLPYRDANKSSVTSEADRPPMALSVSPSDYALCFHASTSFGMSKSVLAHLCASPRPAATSRASPPLLRLTAISLLRCLILPTAGFFYWQFLFCRLYSRFVSHSHQNGVSPVSFAPDLDVSLAAYLALRLLSRPTHQLWWFPDCVSPIPTRKSYSRFGHARVPLAAARPPSPPERAVARTGSHKSYAVYPSQKIHSFACTKNPLGKNPPVVNPPFLSSRLDKSAG
ncbi:hypothetical protein BDV93DRAFT_514168 [Ceratobasidium sp. AG-I]|nr:hypothetical protein BDV93DRAFT_514168 [Ceratobasidium sp. AG-I]